MPAPEILAAEILAAAAGVVISVGVGRAGIRAWARKKLASRDAADRKILLKIAIEKDSEREAAAAQNLLAALAATHRAPGLVEKLAGREAQPRFSFEIANLDGKILFFVWTPESGREFLMSQIYAQYPGVDIEEAPDYAAKPAGPEFFAGELGLARPEFFGVKTFIELGEVDPLAAIAGALGDSGDADFWLQITAEPAGPDWIKKAEAAAETLMKAGDPFPAPVPGWKKFAGVIFCPVTLPFRILKKIAAAGAGPAEPPRPSDRQKFDAENIARKASKPAFRTAIRIGFVPRGAADPARARAKIASVAAAFGQFALPNSNQFVLKMLPPGAESLKKFQNRAVGGAPGLGIDELAGIFHLPTKNFKTANVAWIGSQKTEPPDNLPDPRTEPGVTTIGETDFRGARKTFGLREKTRARHVYIIGKTGMGKSTLLENMIESDILLGRGVGVIDPHGELCEKVLSFIPKNRINDVVYFDPSDKDFPIGFNLFDIQDPDQFSIAADGIVGIYQKMFADSWGPRMGHILRNIVIALIWNPDTTMIGILRMISDGEYRDKIAANVRDPICRDFWQNEFPALAQNERNLAEIFGPIQNKIGQFLSSPVLRNVLGQPKSKLTVRSAMDEGKILLMGLSKGKIGDINSNILGSMLITKFQVDAMARADMNPADRRPFYLYVDEFQNFATESFATILSEARKYGLALTMANQFVNQMAEEVRDAVFGNVGSLMSFQVNPVPDGETISKQFSEIVTKDDLANLGVGQVYLKTLVDSMPTNPFMAKLFPPVESSPDQKIMAKIREQSRERYATPRAVVEEKILRFAGGAKENADKNKLREIEMQKLRSEIGQLRAELTKRGITPPPPAGSGKNNPGNLAKNGGPDSAGTGAKNGSGGGPRSGSNGGSGSAGGAKSGAPAGSPPRGKSPAPRAGSGGPPPLEGYPPARPVGEKK